MVPVIALTFVSAFVGYAQSTAGFTAYARLVGVFALGETLLQPTIPAITNDLSPDHLRGRYNAVMAGAFQLAAVTGPVVAGVMLGARFNVAFIGMLILGCAVMALIAVAVERRIPAQANGIRSAAADLSRG